jgi:hypothetical protein
VEQAGEAGRYNSRTVRTLARCGLGVVRASRRGSKREINLRHWFHLFVSLETENERNSISFSTERQNEHDHAPELCRLPVKISISCAGSIGFACLGTWEKLGCEFISFLPAGIEPKGIKGPWRRE